MGLIYTPWDYQDRAFDFIIDVPYCALWMEMGLGKTVTSLTAADFLLDSFKTHQILVVSPLRVANSTWPDEISKWEHTKHLDFSVITGAREQRIKALKSKAPIHIVNFDNIVWLVKHVLTETGGRWPYDMMIVDESSWVKSMDAKRYQAIKHVRPAVERLVELTGSPSPNGLLDLWSQMYLLDYGERLGNTYKAMKDRWYQPVGFTDYGPTYEIKPGAASIIHKRVSDIALSLRAKDYLDLPDDIDVPVYIDLPDHLLDQYNELERQMFLELDGVNIEAVNGGALSQKCRQFANGFLYDADRTGHYVHDLKIKALREVIMGAEGQPIVIGYQYKEDLAAIKKAFPHAQLLGTNPRQIHDWNAGKIPLLLAHAKSAGHGLNMQDGGHIVVLFGIDWSLELYEQLIARLSRQGQVEPVIIYHIMARDTVDELMLIRVNAKDKTQKSLKHAVSIYHNQKWSIAA